MKILELVKRAVEEQLELDGDEMYTSDSTTNKGFENVLNAYLSQPDNKNICNLKFILELAGDNNYKSLEGFVRKHEVVLLKYFNVSNLSFKIKDIINRNARYIVDMIYVQNIYGFNVSTIWRHYFRRKFSNSIRIHATYSMTDWNYESIGDSYCLIYKLLHMDDEYITKIRGIGKIKMEQERDVFKEFNTKNIRTLKDIYALLKDCTFTENLLAYNKEEDTLCYLGNGVHIFGEGSNAEFVLHCIMLGIDIEREI